VHIAYWFAKLNNKLKSAIANQNKPKNKKDKASNKTKLPSALPQVLYCGPSNKSVDVVTGISYI
jgi:hypothetical protein